MSDHNEAPMPEEEVAHSISQSEAESEAFIDLTELPAPEALPAVIGFTQKHTAINHELIGRVTGFLMQPCTVESYAISEYYGNQIREAITVVIGKVKINIDLISEKK